MPESNCISCNSAPSPCNCSSSQTCVQTPRTCSTCPQNICINSPGSSNSNSSSSNLGGAIGGAIGGLAAGALIVFSAWFLHRRNLLPRFFYLKKSASSTSSKNRSSSTKGPSFKSKSSRSHQSIIYLPTENRELKNSGAESDDDHDPFSDKHSGVSIIGPSPKLQAISPGVASPSAFEFMVSPPNPSVPAAYIPPSSKSLSIADAEERDGLRNSTDPNSTTPHSPPSALNHSPSTPEGHPSPSLVVPGANQRSSFLTNPTGLTLPTPPPPSGNPTNPFKPIRPQRAPDLNLQLPSAIDTLSEVRESLDEGIIASHRNLQVPGTNLRRDLGSRDGMPHGSRLSLGSEQSDLNLRRISCSSEATTHDSHLSSILDPAMIVTPVTLVRTASGRQAAVQRVALRGQEKARVVRLPPNSNLNPHGPSPLSLSNDSQTLTSPNARETFGFSPTSTAPQVGDAKPRQSMDTGNTTCPTDLDPHLIDLISDSVAVSQAQSNDDLVEAEPGETKPSGLRRGRSTAGYSVASSSFCGSSVCDSFIEDEEVEFPTVLGRSAAFLAHRQQQQQALPPLPFSPTVLSQLDHSDSVVSTTSHHQISMKALGRDRAISLSSIITEEAARTSSCESPPPPLPTSSFSPNSSRSGSGAALPQPFKPFAGQKPSTSRKTGIGGSRTSKPLAQTQSIASTTSDSQSRLSTVSSIRSGYGSVLEGIPFNIGFNSENDDLFTSLNNLSGGSGSPREAGGITGGGGRGGRSGGPGSNVSSSCNSSAAGIMGLGLGEHQSGRASESSFGLNGQEDDDEDDGCGMVLGMDEDSDAHHEFGSAIPSTPSTVIGRRTSDSTTPGTNTTPRGEGGSGGDGHSDPALNYNHPQQARSTSGPSIDADEAHLALAYLGEI